MIWQFLSAALTDLTETWAQYFLLLTLVIQTVCDIGVYFLFSSKWWVLAYFVIRFSLVNQLGNSLSKIFKMRIEMVMKLPPEEQMLPVNIFAITADLIGRVMVISLYTLILALWVTSQLTYDWLTDMCFLVMIALDGVSLVCNIMIPFSYFLPPKTVGTALAASEAINDGDLSVSEDEDAPKNALRSSTSSVDRPDDLASSSASAFSSAASDNFKSSDAIPKPSRSSEKSPLLGNANNEDPENVLVLSETEASANVSCGKDMSAWEYLKYCCKSVWYNKLLLHSTAYVWLVSTVFGYVSLILTFAVANSGEDHTDPTRNNFCGNSVIILVQTNFFSELCRIIAALIFQVYMNNLSPLWFYRVVQWVFSLIVALLTFANIFNLPTTLSSAILGVINISFYLSINFSTNVSQAVLDANTAGFVFGVQGTVEQLLGLLPVGVSNLVDIYDIPTQFITGSVVVTSIWVACFSSWFAHRYKKELATLTEGTEPHKSKIARCLFGY